MITLKEGQMEAFKINALQKFIDDMVLHSYDFSPELCEYLNDEQLRWALKDTIATAKKYGFTNKGPVQLYIDLSFLFGSFFDTDPLFTNFSVILLDNSNQMFRAEQLHLLTSQYLKKVHGPNNMNIDQAMISVINILQAPLPQTKSHLETNILNEFKNIFPQRADYIGDEILKAFIQRAGELAPKLQLSPVSGHILLVMLMSIFGYGCTQDKLYPWISKTLLNNKIKDPQVRTERLQRKMVIWLAEVLKKEQLEKQHD